MNQADLFKRLGYPKHTEKIYEVIVGQSTPVSVTSIAKEINLARTVVYRGLENLCADRIVKQVDVGKRIAYTLVSSQALQKKISSISQSDAALVNSGTSSPDVPSSIRFFSGSKGITQAFDEVIQHSKRGNTFLRYTSEKDLEKVNGYLSDNYRVQRDKKKLERQVISNSQSAKQKKSRLERFIKYIPSEADQFEQNIIQLIYSDFVSIIDLNTEQVTIIENKQLADFQRVIFNLLYKRL